jgi:hypothetical protein
MLESISDAEILNSFNNVIKYLPSFFDDDIAFAISDRSKYLKIQNGEKIHLNLKDGAAVPTGGALFEALKTGKTIVKFVPEEVYGFELKSYAIPIKDNDGKVVGGVAVAKSLERKIEVTELSQNLSTSLKQISSAINELSSGVQNVVTMNSEVLGEVKNANENTKDTNGILSFVQGISTQTNLLGLNASIEAARAGESGRGFNVVATEIRKLSSSTNESIKKIDSVLKNVGISIGNITEKVTKTTDVFQDQAATLEEIAASIEQLTLTAEKLDKLAENL